MMHTEALVRNAQIAELSHVLSALDAPRDPAWKDDEKRRERTYEMTDRADAAAADGTWDALWEDAREWAFTLLTCRIRHLACGPYKGGPMAKVNWKSADNT